MAKQDQTDADFLYNKIKEEQASGKPLDVALEFALKALEARRAG